MSNQNIRNWLIDTVQSFHTHGLSAGKSGNASARTDTGFVITPTGVEYVDLQTGSLVEMDLNGKTINGNFKPSSEWRFHSAIYSERSDVNAVVHVHSPYATGIACTRQDIPAFHYMVAMAGGDNIRCADYATFGTEELAKNALIALKGRDACLLANHGQISLGTDLGSALALAIEVENLARQYWISRQGGTPVLLDADEMKVNLEKFDDYGKQ
ncbi:MAG: class II aldolase/adducin family protein [Thiotrichales bacterium]|nr:class II aldolase/adducin family protein [Thiotrichales bacterium]